jgi:CP family cyanate transporter-like MFS transporter
VPDRPVDPVASVPAVDLRLPVWAGRTAALVGILAIALNLRSSVAALSPIIDLVSHDIPLNSVIIGVIGAAPPVTFAVTGLFTPWVSRRLGLEGGLLLAAGLMTVGNLARALSPSVGVLIATTVLILIGAGVGNVLLPPVVKRYFPDRIAQVTSVYAILIAISTALPALLAVPVAQAVGWRFSLGEWAALGVVAIAPWIVATVQHRRALALAKLAEDEGGIETETALEGRLFRSPVAWAVMIVFSISSLNVYAAFAWLPSLLVQSAHVSTATAGGLLSLYAFMGFPTSLVTPYLAARIRNKGLLVYIALGGIVIGDLGLILAPAALPALWIIIAGLGPLLFPLSLVLINTRTRTHAGSVALSGFVQGLGYLFAASGPLVFGILHQATHEWTAPLLFILGLSVVAGIPAAVILTRGRMLEDELGAQVRIPA